MATAGAIASMCLQLIFMMDQLSDSNGNVALEIEIEELRLAISILILEEEIRPGKGYTYFGQDKLEPRIGSIPTDAIDLWMNSPSKCLKYTGWSPKEIRHLLSFVEAEIDQHGAIHGNGHYRQCKASLLVRLIILLWSLQSSETMYRLEATFQWAKSSINDDKYHMAAILLSILKRELGTLWPNHADQLLLIEMLPASLREKNIFYIVDSTKIPNNDSTHLQTRQQHWNNHKGFGCHMILYTNILGDIIHFEPMRDGNGSDIQQYRSSDVFQQSNGCTFVKQHSGMGDTAYKGASSSDPNSADLVEKFDLNDPFLRADPILLALAERFNDDFDTIRSVVERSIRGVKRENDCGERSSLSLKQRGSSEAHRRLFNELAGYLSIARHRMRGQHNNSNPEMVSPGLQGPNAARRVIHDHMDGTLTADGRKNAFWGAALTGLNFDDIPDILPLNRI